MTYIKVVLDLVGNPKDQFSSVTTQIILTVSILLCFLLLFWCFTGFLRCFPLPSAGIQSGLAGLHLHITGIQLGLTGICFLLTGIHLTLTGFQLILTVIQFSQTGILLRGGICRLIHGVTIDGDSAIAKLRIDLD